MHFLSGGPYFSYSLLEKGTAENGEPTNMFERLEFVESEEATVKIISSVVLAPLRVYWDETGEVCVLVYSKHFSVYKISSRGSLLFLRMLEYSLIEGHFWEKLFFFYTGQSLYVMIMLTSNTLVVELATKNPIDSGFRV